MKENSIDGKKTIYAGMSIFDLIKDVDIILEKQVITLQDKKYLSLYLGIINTNNIISEYLKSKNINIGTFINFRYLNPEEYLDIYNKYFVDIFKEISFESINDNLEYLLDKEIIKKFNKSNNYNINNLIKTKNDNKQYINSLKYVEQ